MFKETKHLFLDLPAFKRAAHGVDRGAGALAVERPRFSLDFVKELKPRPITRDLDWGVPIPVPGYEESDDKRIYVWFDAVIGYLSASIEWAANRGHTGRMARLVAEPDAEHTYFMGKDNIVFHTRDLAEHAARVRPGGEIRRGPRRARAPGRRRRRASS